MASRLIEGAAVTVVERGWFELTPCLRTGIGAKQTNSDWVSYRADEQREQDKLRGRSEDGEDEDVKKALPVIGLDMRKNCSKYSWK